MTRTGRTRLTPEARRAQLLTLGAELFSRTPFSQVRIEEIAERAGVSRGLLYRYFPTKRDFVVAMIAAEADALRELLVVDPTLPVAEQLRSGLDGYLDYVEGHADGYRAVYGASLAADLDVRRIVAANNRLHEDTILGSLRAAGMLPDGESEVVRVAVRGWLAFVVTVSLDWLERRTLTRDEVRELCARSLLAAVESLLPA
ncbi:TetR/AcrR family transcriptional regulator [Rhodococcus aerolatus]